MRQNLFSDLTPCFWVFSDKMGSKPSNIGPSSSKKTKNGLNWSKIVQNLVFSAYVEFFRSNKIFYGKCGIPFSRGERARHFELLFVAFYSRIVSTYEAEGCKMLQVEPFS